MNKLNLKVVKTQKESANEVELYVETVAEVSDKAYALAFRNISNSVDIPGFRKGKAPKEVIEKNVGVGYISQKAFENVFHEILIGAAIQEKLEIVDVVQISSYELLPGKPLSFKAIVELKPEVDLGKYKGLKVKSKKYAYEKDLFLTKTLEKIVNNLISFKKNVDRNTVKEGDLIEVDFEGKFEDGSLVPGGKAENFQVILEKDKFLPEFVDKLVGVKVGETNEILITFPENYNPDFSGKKAKFTAKVNSLEEKVIPEVNDELAKKLGLENLDALKSKIVNQMLELQEQNNNREFENKLVDEIVQSSKCNISKRMVEREADFLLQDIKKQCENNAISWDTFKADKKNKQIFEKAREAAIKRIYIDLVLSAIVKEEKIEATKEEIEKEVNNRISHLGEKYKGMENDPKFLSTVELIILRNKAVDHLIENNIPVWEEEVTKIMPE